MMMSMKSAICLLCCVGITLEAFGNDPVELGVMKVGQIQAKEIKESSGVIASRTQPGVLWTHNDGNGKTAQQLYSIDRTGKLLGIFPLSGIPLVDWEDIAIDAENWLYIADIGNNELDRRTLTIHRIKEPSAGSRAIVKKDVSWELQFPGNPFDAEALIVWMGNGYIFSKVKNDRQAEMFRFPLSPGGGSVQMELVARLLVTSPVTGADLTSDGKHLGLVAKAGAYLFDVNGEPRSAGQLKPRRIKFKKGQIEGVCFVEDGLLTTSETRDIFLFKGLK